ncbi:MAG: hypothetical protein ABI612_26905 [Betaproteobacteria bacterium]
MRSLQLFLSDHLLAAPDDLRDAIALAPGLHRLLRRAGTPDILDLDIDAAVLDAFGVVRQRDWPVAPITCLADGGDPGQRFWLRADPVHLRAERDALVLADARLFDVTPQAAQAFVASLNNHFNADGLQFFALTPNRWYVTAEPAPDLQTQSLNAAAGRNVDQFLPTGRDGLTWHRTFNEIQMLFHEHAVNQAREGSAELPINSVWLWGGGVLPAIGSSFAGVWATNPIARGSAIASSTPLEAVPNHASAWLQSAKPGDHLLMLDDAADAGATRAAELQRLDALWLTPLLDAVSRGQLDRLALHIADEAQTLRFTLNAGDRWKFWHAWRPAWTADNLSRRDS